MSPSAGVASALPTQRGVCRRYSFHICHHSLLWLSQGQRSDELRENHISKEVAMQETLASQTVHYRLTRSI